MVIRMKQRSGIDIGIGRSGPQHSADTKQAMFCVKRQSIRLFPQSIKCFNFLLIFFFFAVVIAYLSLSRLVIYDFTADRGIHICLHCVFIHFDVNFSTDWGNRISARQTGWTNIIIIIIMRTLQFVECTKHKSNGMALQSNKKRVTGSVVDGLAVECGRVVSCAFAQHRNNGWFYVGIVEDACAS